MLIEAKLAACKAASPRAPRIRTVLDNQGVVNLQAVGQDVTYQREDTEAAYPALGAGMRVFGVDSDDSSVICIDGCAAPADDEAGMTLAQRIASRDRAWKLEELASLLNCSRGKLYGMVNTGRIPYIRVGSMIRFDPKSTASWIMDKASWPLS